MRNIIALIVFLFFAIVAVFLYQKYSDNQLPFFRKTPTAAVKSKSFKLLVANSSKEKQIGLSNKKSLPQNYGMIFPYKTAGFYAFWMKDMKFPIDIIFIRNGRIVTIHSQVQPPKAKSDYPLLYLPQEPSDTVLEINAGLSKKYEFKNGDSVRITDL